MRPGTLNEITDAQHNARTQASSMPPPTGLKRPTSQHGTSNPIVLWDVPSQSAANCSLEAAPQPDPKQRKTLIERAAEYPDKHSIAATPAPRSFNKGVSLASQQSGVSSASLQLVAKARPLPTPAFALCRMWSRQRRASSPLFLQTNSHDAETSYKAFNSGALVRERQLVVIHLSTYTTPLMRHHDVSQIA